MRRFKSCGVFVFRREPELSFLLLRHPDRLDLPKGHLHEGESEVACALRELAEETGLDPAQIQLQSGFRFVTTYQARYRRFGEERVEKTVVIFLGWLAGDSAVVMSEHAGYEWVRWQPPHQVGAATVDQLLLEVERFLGSLGAASP